MLKFKKLKKLFLSGLKNNSQSYTIEVEVPLESTDWSVDDFLGNSFQYKINDSWYYDTSVKLPNHHSLKIKGVSSKSTNYKKIVEIDATF